MRDWNAHTSHIEIKVQLSQYLTSNMKISLSAECRQKLLVAGRSTFILQTVTSYREHVFSLTPTLIHEILTPKAGECSKTLATVRVCH
jgi:hypothetical protein